MRLADVFVAVRADMTDVNRAFKGLESSLGGVQKSLGNMGATLTRNVTLPILAVGGATSKMALDFERTMGQLVGLAGVPVGEIDALRESITALSSETGRGPQELAEAFYFVASAGFEADEALKVLEMSARASAAGMGQTQKIAQVLGGVINSYGQGNLDAARAADILTAAIGRGAAEADSFAAALPQVVPTAALLGVEFEEVAGALAAITNTGASAEMAAVGLNQVFTTLLKPTTEANDTLAAFGLSAAGLRDQLASQGTIAVLRTLEQTFGDNDEAMTSVFGNVRAMRAAFGLLGLDAAQLDSIMADTADSSKATADAFAAIPDDVLAFDRAMADLQVAAIQLGRDALPTVTDILKRVAEGVRVAVKWWKSLDDETKQAVINFALIAAAAGPVLKILGALVGVGRGVVTGVKGVVLAGKLLHRAWLNVPTVLGIAELAMGKVTGALKALKSAGLGSLGPLGLLVAALHAAATAYDGWLASAEPAEAAFMRLGAEAGRQYHHISGTAVRVARELGIGLEEAKARIVAFAEETGAGWDEAVEAVLDGADQMEAGFASSSSAAHSWSRHQQEAYDDAAGAARDGSEAIVGEFIDMNGDMVTVFEDGSTAVNGEFAGMTEDMIEAARKAREAAVAEMADMLAGMAALFESDEDVQKAYQDLLDRMDDPYTETERKADIFSQNMLTVIATALASDDPGAVAEATALVNRLLAEFDVLEPGALESGEAVPPAIRDGMDAEMQALIDYIEENVTGEALSALSLAEAEAIGIEGIWLYNQGMLSQERAAGTAGQRVSDAAKQGVGSIDFTETGGAKAQEVATGMGRKHTDLRLAGYFASIAAKGGFDSVDFTSGGSSIIDELIWGINDNVWRLQSAMRGAAQVSRDVMPESEPKDPRSPWRGITKLGGNLIGTIADSIYGSLGTARRASLAMAGAFAPNLGFSGLSPLAAAPVSAMTSIGEGGATVGVGNTYQVYVESLSNPPTLAEIGSELKRLGEMGVLPK